jgi:hypothetical protein
MEIDRDMAAKRGCGCSDGCSFDEPNESYQKEKETSPLLAEKSLLSSRDQCHAVFLILTF